MPDVPNWIWYAWLLSLPGTFLVLEGVAVANGTESKDALTHTLRRLFATHTRRGAFAFLLSLGGFFGMLIVWLGAHIVQIPV